MSPAAFLLAPFLALLPVSGAVETRQDAEFRIENEAGLGPAEDAGPFRATTVGFRPRPAMQVRIEQQMIIRVTPHARPALPNMLMTVPPREAAPRYVERKIGKCLPVGAIAGVQVYDSSRLLLFLRDRRMISASLERTCRSRDFYSGFYLSPSADRQLCVERDSLHSRSGANCKLTKIRQLVAIDE